MINNHGSSFEWKWAKENESLGEISVSLSLFRTQFQSGKGKAVPIQAKIGSEGARRLSILGFWDNRHMNVVRLSALHICGPYPQGKIPGTRFCYTLSWPQGHSAAGSIKSMQIVKDPIGNRTRDLPACSTVPPPTALPRPISNLGCLLPEPDGL